MIYFAKRQDGLVKIGYTSSTAGKRLRELEREHGELAFLGSIPSGRTDQEKELHRQFASARVSGEWFNYTQDLQRFIEDLEPTTLRTRSTSLNVTEQLMATLNEDELAQMHAAHPDNVAKSEPVPLGIADCVDILTAALVAVQEVVAIGIKPSPAAGTKPAGVVVFVEGMTLENGTLVPLGGGDE